MTTRLETEIFGGDATLPEPVSETINMIVEKAKENFLRDGELHAAAFMLDKEGQATVIGLQLPPSNDNAGRDAIGDLLRDTARKTMPVAVMFLSETWMIDTEKLENWLKNITFSPADFGDTAKLGKILEALDLNPIEFECSEGQALLTVGELMVLLTAYLSLPEKGSKEASDLMMHMKDRYNTLYGSMGRMPGAIESLYFTLETLWGDYLKKINISREGDEVALDENPEVTGWTEQKEGGRITGRFANLLVKTPTSDDV